MGSELDVNECTPPHRVTHPKKLRRLIRDFRQRGWSIAHPALVGYKDGNIVQLLSGSHRWAAAKAVGIKIPVVVTSYENVLSAWGDLDMWYALMRSGDRQ